MPDFDSLSAGGAITSGAGGSAGSGGRAGSGGIAGTAGSSGAAGAGGSGGRAGTGGSGGSGSGLLPDGGIANLIVNPDFEETAVTWTAIGNCLLRIVTEPTAQSGSRALEVSNRTLEWEGPGYSVLNLIQAGEIYDAGVWVRVAEGEIPLQLTYKRRCEGDGDVGSFAPMGTPIIATTAWAYLSGSLATPTCDPLESVIFVEVPNTSAGNANAHVTLYLDNTSLVNADP